MHWSSFTIERAYEDAGNRFVASCTGLQASHHLKRQESHNIDIVPRTYFLVMDAWQIIPVGPEFLECHLTWGCRSRGS